MAASISWRQKDIIVAFGLFLDTPSIALAMVVCRTWRDHLKNLAAHAKEDEYCRRIGYHPELVQALRARQLSLWRLPELHLGNRVGNTEYIDFLTTEDTTSPLMRFTDRSGRVGFAVRWEGNADGTITLPSRSGEVECSIRKISSVIAIFQHHHDRSSWVSGSLSGDLHLVYNKFSGLSYLPFLNQNCIKFLASLIAKTDPAVKISGAIEQVPTLLPSMPLPASPVAASSPSSIPQSAVERFSCIAFPRLST